MESDMTKTYSSKYLYSLLWYAACVKEIIIHDPNVPAVKYAK